MNKKLLKMIGKRVLQSIIAILIVTMIVFFLSHLVPGDPVLNYLGANASTEQIEHYTQLYGFDKPVYVQYIKWVGGLFRGDMGYSISYQCSITDIIFDRLGTTLNITVPAFIIAVIFGISLGIIAALNRGKPIDTLVTLMANIGVSMPLFWVGMLLILIFGINLKILPTSGYTPIGENFIDWIRHIIMPVFVCSFLPLAQFTRQTRSSLLEVIRQEYVTTAKAKGLNRAGIILKHQVRNALIPIITVVGGQFGHLVGTTVLIESVFVLPGLGNLMISGIRSRDYMVVASCVLIIAIFVAVCNLIVDILYGFIDPRIREK